MVLGENIQQKRLVLLSDEPSYMPQDDCILTDGILLTDLFPELFVKPELVQIDPVIQNFHFPSFEILFSGERS